MGETYTCDVCDARIKYGYTVCWSHTLERNPSGVHFSENTTRNICNECWPRESSLTGRVRRLLDRLGYWIRGDSE